MSGTAPGGAPPGSYVEVGGGGRLRYRLDGEGGDGSPIVLIHPAFLDSRVWEPLIEGLAINHPVVRNDVRGHGASTGRLAEASDEDDLLALLDHLGFDRAVLIGNSDGARIASAFAHRHPERVGGLVLIAGVPSDVQPTEVERQHLEGSFEERGGAFLRLVREDRKAEAVDLALRMFTLRAREADRAWLRTIALENADRYADYVLEESRRRDDADEGTAAWLERGSVPMLVVVGLHDDPVARGMVQRFAERVPSARYVELTQGDHVPMVSARPEFEAFLREFLHRVEHHEKWPPDWIGYEADPAGLPTGPPAGSEPSDERLAG